MQDSTLTLMCFIVNSNLQVVIEYIEYTKPLTLSDQQL